MYSLYQMAETVRCPIDSTLVEFWSVERTGILSQSWHCQQESPRWSRCPLPQAKAWGTSSALQVLWNCTRSLRALVSNGSLIYQVGWSLLTDWNWRVWIIGYHTSIPVTPNWLVEIRWNLYVHRWGKMIAGERNSSLSSSNFETQACWRISIEQSAWRVCFAYRPILHSCV